MLSRLATVLQELSGEEAPDGDPEQMLVLQLPPAEGQAQVEFEVPEETIERLAHLEQLVVHLNDLIRDKDSQLAHKDDELASKDAQLKNERETAEARFTKLKLQAKAKMTSLSKQITELKGQEATTSPDSSFTGSGSAVEEELEKLKSKLSEVEANSRAFQEQLQTTELLLQEKEATHAEQLRVLQAVVFEKDVRFQEQIQKHEEELLKVTAQTQNDSVLQQALHVSQRRGEELEEAMRSRSQVLDMLQQELNSADQQKQILTAQFRQMEQELAEAVRQREEERQQWAQDAIRANAELESLKASQEVLGRERTEVARLESELASLREAEHRARAASQEVLEREKTEVARLERELASVKEAELAAIQAGHDVSERDRTDIARREAEVTSVREAEITAIHTSQEALERERSEVERLKKELTALKEEQGESHWKGETLAKVWRILRALASGDEHAAEESSSPTDFSMFLSTIQSLEAQLTRLKEEQNESEQRCIEVTLTMDTLKKQLDRRTSEQEEADAKIQQLEQQIGMKSNESLIQHVADQSVQDEKDVQILALEQQLLERGNELAALRESLTLFKEQDTRDASGESCDQTPEPANDAVRASHDSPAYIPDLLEDTKEEESTLVAEDTSVLSVSADNESSPELIGPQSESPGESKGASSDEMITSSDSEVAHSSWTLLEAVNHDGGQEWPSILQDFGQLQLQSWEETSVDHETTTVQEESSSVVIQEKVQIQLTRQGTSSDYSDLTSGQVFAQTLAEELQKRYSELLAELQRLRETSTDSQEKVQSLKKEKQLLEIANVEVESQVQSIAKELKSAKEELDELSQQHISVVEKHWVEMNLLQEKICILQTETKTKEEKIQALQSDLVEAKEAHSEQEAQVRMLNVQLEDRELYTSELEQKLQDMENSLLEYSQTTDLNNASLSEKDSKINDLQLQLTEKEQEMMELSDSVSAKLLQAGEEKVLINSEVKRLKEQITELEKQKVSDEHSDVDVDNPVRLRKEKEDLEIQLTNLKKKLQVALVQRKELIKKVADFEEEAMKWKEQSSPTAETSTNMLGIIKNREQEIEELKAKLSEVKEALISKEQIVETLEQKIRQHDQVLVETLALNQKPSQEVEHSQQIDNSASMTELQSQMTSLEAECEALQKKLLEAQESRKETIRKAKEKDRHHREQLKQQKEEYSELLERFRVQGSEQEVLLIKLKEQEEENRQKKMNTEKDDLIHQETKAVPKKLKKPTESGWVQEGWVDFPATETDIGQPELGGEPVQHLEVQVETLSSETEACLQTRREEVQAAQMARTELEEQLQETKASLYQKENELLHFVRELEGLREKERQIDVLSEDTACLRVKYLQAESYIETLKREVEAASKAASESSIGILQAEVEEVKQFLDNKNQEIMQLSQQLSEQNSLLYSVQNTVAEKDQLIASLQKALRAEQEKAERLEAERPQNQEEEKDSEAKIQQLQRKFQAALISRKEVLKENKIQKEELASNKKVIAELQQNLETKEDKQEKLRAEKIKLIEEVDRALLENQSLGSSCESLKLAMEGIITEKDSYKREAEIAKEEAARACQEWEEKIQGMKDEYETLLKSYENVSDEAERVRRVLEAARQERQELAARVRTHEAARQQAERQAEEAHKEVDSVKDKMRKFAKTKQQKIMELEEENEKFREMEEKKEIKREDKALKFELERLKEELMTLKTDLDATVAERDSLGQQVEELKEFAQEKMDSQTQATSLSSEVIVEESAVTQQLLNVMTDLAQKEPFKSQSEEAPAEEGVMLIAPETHPHPAEERIKMEITVNEGTQVLLEDKIREVEAALSTERELIQGQEADFKAEVASLEQQLQEGKEREHTLMTSLEQCIQESKEKEQRLMQESSRWEAQAKEVRRSLEAEKDDLEERLMNQLAQLNGSIAGYQQDAADTRERLVELQREVERLGREKAELEAQAQSERDRGARLEEDKRQAQRERDEAEAESGKQRELEQQLKSAQRVKEGSQSRARQLEELLREKQLEVRQLQKDSIQYQERISELGREVKALHLSRDEIQKKLEQSHLETSKAIEDMKVTEAELVTCKGQLDEAQKEASKVLAGKIACEQTALQKEAMMKVEAEQTLDSVRFRLGAELKQMELRLEEAYREREKEEEATLEARDIAEGAKRQAQEMQFRLDESLARLAAFSRCMSSLQDDRDRVLEEARQWETRFNSTLQGKESELREAETRAKELADQLQKETALNEELQLAINRFEKTDKDWQVRLEEEEKKVQEIQAALEQESVKLERIKTEMESNKTETCALEDEMEGLCHRTQALEEAVERLQGELNHARAELSEREAGERRLCLNVEQLETDLRSSKVLTESLQTELSEKERREVELLGEKEQAVTQAAEEARREADSRAQEAEKELEKRREEFRDLEDKLGKVEEESNHRKARLDSFMKAMGSLQDDRDCVLNMYKQLEEKHLQVMMEKDGLIQEAAAENNSLKEELRSLLVQRDDLYAEKGKLSAQLHGYREELNQVLSMKESQHKRLLASQQERIASLEKQCQDLEAHIKSFGKDGDTEMEVMVSRVERETLSQTADSRDMPQVKDAPGAEVEKLREQLHAARDQVETLEQSLLEERQEKVARGKELAELRWEGGVMRTESESAQERVAELAQDLMVVEQRLLEEQELTTQIRAENESFGKAMASLQDSRDQAVMKAQELSFQLEEMSKAGDHPVHSTPKGSTGEVWGLKNALQALQNDRERLLEQLQKQTSELQRQKLELARLGAGELIQVSQELREEKRMAEEQLTLIKQLEEAMETGKQEIETLRLERIDWMAQAEQLKQQTLATLSERDQQLRQLTAMLEEAHAPKRKHLEEHYQREGTEEVDSAPGAPQERSSPLENHTCMAEVKELQRRLDEEMDQRMAIEELLMAAQDRLKRHSQGEWHSAHEASYSETAVLIEPPDGAVTQTRRGGPGLMRMLRVAFCSRQRTPLLFSLYLLTVHALLLLCLGGYL
ncbi:golgin subfamily B member 1 [Lampris incognitus]|uniref:golgin subfamily B member 1 n=1 Tax=Lampris incognitus TaxID=2546036 RepID=UPI0024B4BBE8|nr:golgin subfamily B member 1 [Lampris incognitus]